MTRQNPIDTEINPILLREDFKEKLSKYYRTALPVSSRFPQLQKEVKENLSLPGRIVKGPYLETLPDFKKGATLENLVQEGLLNEKFLSLEESLLKRKLHSHQEEAFRQVIQKKENVIVATGTGSGKTECFLFPLVNYLLGEAQKGSLGQGVKAILVYPMNALADDQLYHRLAPLLCEELGDTGITFGRYTGTTSTTDNRSTIEEETLDIPYLKDVLKWKSVPRNWLLSREDMLKTPPNILVTNHSMLEHILFFPKNERLLQGAELKFLILDEVHCYGGAQATEVAFLLRKLKQRFSSCSKPMCIGTSASLPKEADQQTLKFASRLFGEPFNQKVIRGQRLTHALLEESSEPLNSFTPDEWSKLYSVVANFKTKDFKDATVSGWNQAIGEMGIQNAYLEDGESHFREVFTKRFSKESPIREVANKLKRRRAIEFRDLAVELFPTICEREAEEALAGVAIVGAFAKLHENAFALLPVRYHYFLASPEEITVRLDEETAENWAGFRTEPAYAEVDGTLRFRLLTCRTCGEPFLEAFQKGETLYSRRPEGSIGKGSSRVLLWFHPKEEEVGSEEDEIHAQIAKRKNLTCPVFLDLGNPQSPRIRTAIADGEDSSQFYQCRKILPGEITNRDDDDYDRALKDASLGNRCPACGEKYNWGEPIISPFSAHDQPTTVAIMSVLYNHLPRHPDPKVARNLPGGGRNLLAFTDGRQGAADFAPKFNDTHRSTLLRSLILGILKEPQDNGPPNLKDLAYKLEQTESLEPKGSLLGELGEPLIYEELSEELQGWVLAEFCCKLGGRGSLESLGMVRINYGKRLNALLRQNEDELADSLGDHGHLVRQLLEYILDLIRLKRAISFTGMEKLQEKDWFWDKGYNFAGIACSLDEPRSQKVPEMRLLPADGHENTLSKFLGKKLKIHDWKGFVTLAWQLFKDDEYGLLIPVKAGKQKMVLNTRSIFVEPAPVDQVWKCNNCGKISTKELGKYCPVLNCSGHLIPQDPELVQKSRSDNYYSSIYMSAVPPAATAWEHTAQLSIPKRQEYEKKFRAGKLNILSCTPTMELGIDLGDLESVFMRNVPPTIANYEQRAGRAGRRAQAVPVCVTYAKNSRWDRGIFERAGDFLKEESAAPYVHLANARLFRRHQFSIVLGAWMNRLGLAEVSPQIGSFFKLPKVINDHGRRFADDVSPKFGDNEQLQYLSGFKSWLAEDGKVALQRAAGLIELIQKEELSSTDFKMLSLGEDALAAELSDALKRLSLEFGDKFQFYANPKNINKKDDLQRALEAKRKSAWFCQQPAHDFLILQGLLPTYTFPIENIRLEVKKELNQGAGANPNSSRKRRYDEGDLIFDKDARQAITEYAPGAEVRGNGRVYTSRGVGYYPRHFMPSRYYKKCGECWHLIIRESNDFGDECPRCLCKWDSKGREFVEPRCFITSIATNEANGQPVRGNRKLPPPALEEQLTTQLDDYAFKPFGGETSWGTLNSSEASLLVVNQGRGQGYAQCSCGYSEAIPPFNYNYNNEHKNPFNGTNCKPETRRWRKRRDFAHEFRTDILAVRVNRDVAIPEDMSFEEGISLRNNVFRTVSEAMRLAIAEDMGLDERELGATFRMVSGKAEFIMFDSISGGAGYVTTYRRDYAGKGGSPVKFLESTLRVLECEHCTDGCCHCIGSYSNQRYWDDFRRKDAHSFVQVLMENAKVFAETGIYDNPQIDSHDVDHALESAREIFLSTSRFTDFENDYHTNPGEGIGLLDLFPGWKLLERLLAEGKKITISAPSSALNELKDPTKPLALRIAERMLPHARDGNLHLATCAAHDLGARPRISTKSSESACHIYDEFPPPLFDSMYSTTTGNLSEGKPLPERAWEKNLKESNYLQRPDSVILTEYEPGDPRKLRRDFAFLKDRTAKKITIVDRYLNANEECISAFKELINLWVEELGLRTSGEFVFRAIEDGEDGFQKEANSLQIEAFLNENLDGMDISRRPLKWKERIHDRKIDFDLVCTNSESGQQTTQTERHRLTLTAGIQNLMNSALECAIVRKWEIETPLEKKARRRKRMIKW